MLTGMARPQDRNLAAAAGVDAFLVKPCPPSELVAEIRRLIAAAKLGRSVQRARFSD
jgi:DNA-binding response OmpR family regulator